MTQVVTRIDDDLLASVDALIARGELANRPEAVRDGLRRLVDDIHRRRTGLAMVEGYRRCPQGSAEGGWSDAATAAMIADEPW